MQKKMSDTILKSCKDWKKRILRDSHWSVLAVFTMKQDKLKVTVLLKKIDETMLCTYTIPKLAYRIKVIQSMFISFDSESPYKHILENLDEVVLGLKGLWEFKLEPGFFK